MKVSETEIKGVKIIKPHVYHDSRGFFMETFRDNFFTENIFNKPLVQQNHSRSQKGVLRGLHYQIKNPQGKLIQVIKGEIFDVAVDLRKSSETFGKYFSITMNEEGYNLLWIPPGFAHGFLSLKNDTKIIYQCSDYYSPEHERTIIWNDRDLNIKWPNLSIKEFNISPKDKQGSKFTSSEVYP